MIALHPLGLDASAFAGVGRALAERGMRTVAVDLPGFGESPAPGAPLTPARLAEPVLELARRMRRRPALLGISMGGRVALEAALVEPRAFRSLVLVSPYLPWRRLRWALSLARLMSPELAERLPVERIWPLLQQIAGALESLPLLRDDEIAKAGVRAIYYASCPATRASIVSAAREMALDPAFGERGLWTRLPQLAVPATFLWGRHDSLVPIRFAHRVARELPHAPQLMLPCLGHALAGAHHRCLAAAIAWSLGRGGERPAARGGGGGFSEAQCLVG